MSAILQDLRYALRMLVKSPGISVIAVLSLGLGIGATGAAFSLIEAIRLRALPYPQADRLVALGEATRKTRPSNVRAWTRYSTYRKWEGTLRSVDRIAAHAIIGAYLTVAGDEEPTPLAGGAISASLFELLGIRPQIGRPIRTADDRVGAAPVVWISDELWRSRFQASPRVLGQTVKLTGTPHEVAGVMPRGFHYEFQSDFWVPLAPYVHSTRARQGVEELVGEAFGSNVADPGNASVFVLGRLAAGMTRGHLRAELSAAAAPRPSGENRWVPSVRPMRQDALAFWRGYDLVFGSVALAVLLIACSNLSGLLLVRAIGRQREFAVRMALGATPARIARLLMAEGVALAVAGGLLGAIFSVWAVEAIRSSRLMLGMLPSAIESGLGGGTFPIAVGLALVTAVLVGLAPVFRLARVAPHRSLRGPAVGQFGEGGRRRSAQVFVTLQIAGAVVLASLAGLGARTYWRSSAAAAGFDDERLLYASFDLPSGDNGVEPEAWAAVREHLLAIPGIETVGVQFRTLLARRFVGWEPPALTVERGGGIFDASGSNVGTFAVDPGFFATLGIPLVAGRGFASDDDPSEAPVAIVNQVAAERWWPGENPIGRRFKFGTPAKPGSWTSVVGVARNAKEMDPVSIVEEIRPIAYFPLRQGVGWSAEIFLRTRGSSAESLIGQTRSVLRRLMPGRMPVVMTQRAVYGSVLDPMRANVLGILGAALCGLFLAAIGVYGVLAYAVERRQQEIGVRVALGAGRASVVRLLLSEASLMALTGLAAGLGSGLAVVRLAQGIFFGGLAADPVTLAGVAAAFFLVTLLASAIPLRRALRVDPIVALRSE